MSQLIGEESVWREARRKKTLQEKLIQRFASIYVAIWWKFQMKKKTKLRKRYAAWESDDDGWE